MAVLSDMLGIEHFTTSNGGTVRSDFLARVLERLGGSASGKRKEELIAACVEAATRRPFDASLLSPGGTVTNTVLQAIVDGVTVNGLGTAPPSPITPTEELAIVTEFVPDDVMDERTRCLAERATREGQDHFRTTVLEAYGSSCAVTASNAAGALEAAHITPYLGPQTNVLTNGICLRADIHRLWDRGQIALHEDTLEILVSDALRVTTYGTLSGVRAPNVPRRAGSRPSRAALRAHRGWCQL